MATATATLNVAGAKTVHSAAEAATALRPLAAPYAEALFALGIVGTGLLAVPVLAGSAAYGVGEAFPGRRPRPRAQGCEGLLRHDRRRDGRGRS